MTHRTAILFAVLAAGCGTSDLDDAENVKTWATSGSALAVYMIAHDPIAFADGEHTFVDPACPVTADDGTTATITGGCTDSEGEQWLGTATIVRSATSDRMLTLDGYGHYAETGGTTTGTAALTRIDATTHDFTVDMQDDGGADTRIAYTGRVVGDYGTRTVWSGSGEVERNGFLEPTGTVQVATTDEVVDDSVCMGQPASGETTVTVDGHVAKVTYDGATDCDMERAVDWTYDGTHRGQITGVYCAMAPGSPANAGTLAVFAIVGAMGVWRRRRKNTGIAGSP